MEKKAGNRGNGRPKGALNKATRELKEMILGALDDAGGQDYLARQANENPVAFLSLIGKVLPTTLNTTVKQDTQQMTITVHRAKRES